jgi:hypothetical protein
VEISPIGIISVSKKWQIKKPVVANTGKILVPDIFPKEMGG